MLNKVQLIGHLGRDPEARMTDRGTKVVNLRLATSETWKDKHTGERKERTEWHSIVIFNENLAKIAEQYTRKGSRIYIEGALQTRKWQAQDGSDRYSVEIVLSQFNGQVTLLDKAERSAPSQEDYGQTRTREERRPSGGGSQGGGSRPNFDLDDDIPF